jgi:hypothetical protein
MPAKQEKPFKMTLNEALDMARIDPVATKALREKLINLEVFKFKVDELTLIQRLAVYDLLDTEEYRKIIKLLSSEIISEYLK